MLLTEIIPAVRLRHLSITVIERLVRICAVMAILVIAQIGIDISLIVVQINRLRLGVIRWIIVIVIRRTPAGIARIAISVPHRRTFDKYRANNIIVAVQIAVTYNLYIQHVRTALSHYGCYILEDARCQACLDKRCVVIALGGLNHAQVVHPTVMVEVQVVNHITARVEQLLELTCRTGLRKSCSNGVEVQIETWVGVVVRYCER